MRQSPINRPNAHHAPAFTVIELLVVIAIIGVLIAIALVISARAASSAKSRATADTIRVLDTTLASYTADKGRIPAKYVFTPPGSSNRYEYAMVDARLNVNNNFATAATPSLERYAAEASTIGSIDSVFKGLDSRFIRPAIIDTISGDAINSISVLDGFGRPIRFVHPAYDGGFGNFWDAANNSLQTNRGTLDITELRGSNTVNTVLRRSYAPFSLAAGRTAGQTGDADEGVCTGESPYFYSAGEDGDPGTRADNVYTVQPTWPVETAKFNN